MQTFLALIEVEQKDISKQDYRHETRIIYNNGKVIAKTRREGRLSAEFIKNALGG